VRLCEAVATLVLFLAAGGGAIGQEPRKEPPVPPLTKEEQARWDRARAILAKPDQVELLSLDPSLGLAGPDEKPQDLFRGWKVLGKTVVKDADARKAVLAAAGTTHRGHGPRCFEPRHGIRAGAGGESVDLVICFECKWVYVYLDKEADPVHLIIGREQKPVLDKVLTDAKVPLPPPAKD
jgi:hypothetical protein